MNKDLIELQVGCKATCVVVLDEFFNSIGQTIYMPANVSDELLFAMPIGEPIFKEKISKLASNGNLTYFAIRKIDELNYLAQNRYISLVKDREFQGYSLPDNVIIVFTVNDKTTLSKISKELYQFCVVAF